MVALDWSTVIVLIVVNGVVDAGGVAYLAGYWSRRRLEAWLTSPDSDPYVDRVVEKVVAKLPPVPVVPTVDDFAEKLRPDLVNMAEQGVSKQIEPLVERIGQRLQAFQASQQASFDAYLSRVTTQAASQYGMGNVDPFLAQIVGLLRAFNKKKEAEAVLALGGFFGQRRPGYPGQPMMVPPNGQPGAPVAPVLPPGMTASISGPGVPPAAGVPVAAATTPGPKLPPMEPPDGGEPDDTGPG